MSYRSFLACEGVVDGAVGAVTDMVNHPVQTVACAVAAPYVLAYQLSKVAVNLADIGLTTLMDEEQGKQKLADYIQPLTACAEAICSKDFKLRDAIKMGASVATQIVVQRKVLGGLSEFYNTAADRAVAFVRSNPAATLEQYAVTPDGILLRAAGGLGKNSTSLRDMGGKGPKNTNNIAKPMDYGHSVIQSEELKDALRTEQFTSIIGVTKHGIERLIERGFTPEEVKSLVFTPDIVKIQNNGVKALIKEIAPGKYNFLVLNELKGKVITALKSLNKQDLINLGKNYGWEL